MSRIVYAHCDAPRCPSRDVPDDAGVIGGRRYQMHTLAHQWEGGAAPRCGFCLAPLIRNSTGTAERSTADKKNTWRKYTIAAGVKCQIRMLVAGTPDEPSEAWSDWREYVTKRQNVFTVRCRARAGYWTFRIEQSGKMCEVEFPQLDIQVSND